MIVKFYLQYCQISNKEIWKILSIFSFQKMFLEKKIIHFLNSEFKSFRTYPLFDKGFVKLFYSGKELSMFNNNFSVYYFLNFKIENKIVIKWTTFS